MRVSAVVILSAFLLSFGSAEPASAEVGKRISVTSWFSSGVLPADPAVAIPASVAVPASYKSKTNFLKVTVSYQYVCAGGDRSAVSVRAGGNLLADASTPVDSNVDGFGTRSRTYYLVPQSQGGPEVPAESMVSVEATSVSGTGCQVNRGTMVVEAVK